MEVLFGLSHTVLCNRKDTCSIESCCRDLLLMKCICILFLLPEDYVNHFTYIALSCLLLRLTDTAFLFIFIIFPVGGCSFCITFNLHHYPFSFLIFFSLPAGFHYLSYTLYPFYFICVVDESGTTAAEHGSADTINPAENGGNSGANNDKNHVQDGSDTAGASTENTVSSQDVFSNSSVGMIFETNSKKLVEDSSSCTPKTPNWKSASAEAGLPTSSTPSPPSYPVKLKNEAKKKKKVAFVSVKAPAPSTKHEPTFHLEGTEKKGGDKEDPFFNLLTGGNKRRSSSSSSSLL